MMTVYYHFWSCVKSEELIFHLEAIFWRDNNKRPVSFTDLLHSYCVTNTGWYGCNSKPVKRLIANGACSSTKKNEMLIRAMILFYFWNGYDAAPCLLLICNASDLIEMDQFEKSVAMKEMMRLNRNSFCLKACERSEDLTLMCFFFLAFFPPQQKCQHWVSHNLCHVRNMEVNFTRLK